MKTLTFEEAKKFAQNIGTYKGYTVEIIQDPTYEGIIHLEARSGKMFRSLLTSGLNDRFWGESSFYTELWTRPELGSGMPWRVLQSLLVVHLRALKIPFYDMWAD